MRATDVAMGALQLARWAHEQLEARVTLENPQASYLWDYYRHRGYAGHNETLTLDQCCFGTAWRKATTLWCFGCKPKTLAG